MVQLAVDTWWVDLWHVREPDLGPGDTIEPGRWGRIVLGLGAYGFDTPGGHPQYFREVALETYRLSQTNSPVSSLRCCFAYEDRAEALSVAAERGIACYRVRPVVPGAPASRHDILWIGWMSEPNATYERVVSQMRASWRGDRCRDVWQGAGPCDEIWEWLIDSPLQVVSREA